MSNESLIVNTLFVPAKPLKDINGREIVFGDEVVLFRSETLYSGQVVELTKKQKISVRATWKKHNTKMSKLLPDGCEYGHIEVTSEYWSIKIRSDQLKPFGSGKNKDLASTPDAKRVVVTGRA